MGENFELRFEHDCSEVHCDHLEDCKRFLHQTNIDVYIVLLYDIMFPPTSVVAYTMNSKAIVISLTAEERKYLETQTRTRTIQAQTVSRVRILILKADG